MGLIMRRNLMAAKSGYTAKDYVQDGLIAMWDGIENAGWGVHDPNATVWKDLIGGRDATCSNVAWDGLAASFGGDGCAATTNDVFAISGDRTAEVVFSSTAASLNQMDVFNVSVGDALDKGFRACLSGYSGQFIVCNGRKFSQHPMLEMFDHVSPTSVSLGYSTNAFVSARVNGELAAENGSEYRVSGYSGMAIGAGSPSLLRPFWGKVFTIRLYNRALTSAEFAANYAIDKARFNIPDAA